MVKKPIPPRYVQPYRYASPNIPLAAIRRFARRIAERFEPDKIILFGSYAYGKPHAESDVDLLVIMRTRNVVDQSIRIKTAFDRLFLFDLIVRTPWQIERGLKDDNWFLREIIEKGKVLYEAQRPRSGFARPRRTGMTQYAVDYRYPGLLASKRQMEAALRHVDEIRLKCRSKLGLSLS